MKLSFCTMGYLEHTTLEEAVKRIASLGYKGVDFWAYSPHLGPDLYDKKRREEVQKLVSTLGLEITGLSVNGGTLALHLNFSHPDPQVREHTFNYYKEVIELAQDVGAPLVNLISGHLVFGVSRTQAWKWNRENIKKLCEEAEKKDITLALHTLTPCESEVIVTLEDTLQLKEEIGSERLKLLIDTADQNVTEPNLVSCVKKVAKDLVYVHVNDNLGEKRGDVHLPPGRGNINWKLFLRTLKEVEYRDWLLVQVHSIGYPVDIDGWALESKEYLEKILREI